jgi:hypothetical protein
VFEPTNRAVDIITFIKTDWNFMYGDSKEMITSDAPVSNVNEVDLHLVVDSDHAGEKFTSRSRTRFVIYLSMATLVWFSKHQPTVDSNVFGAEFVGMKNGIETCRGLRYELIMMDVALSGPTYVYVDNMSVVHNTHRPESVLKKNPNSICYHTLSESSSMVDSIIGHGFSVENPANIFVKLLPLPQPPVRARTDARTNQSAQRATQLRRVLARVYAVSI